MRAQGGEVGFCDFVGAVVVGGFVVYYCMGIFGSRIGGGCVGAVLVVTSCIALSVCIYTPVDRLVVVIVELFFGGVDGSVSARRGKLRSGFGRD